MSALALLAASGGGESPTVSVLDPEAATVPYPHEGPPYNAPYPMDFTHIMTHNGGRTVHPTVVDFGPGATWNGHRFWMCINDFGYGGDEDPWIVVSPDGFNWTEPSGVSNPISTVPLQNSITTSGPDGWLNTDPEMVYDAPTDTMHLWWREIGPSDAGTRLWHSTSTDGVTWATPVHDTDGMDFDDLWKSPGIVRVGPNDWRMWAFWDRGPGLSVKTATSPDGPWSDWVNCNGDDRIIYGWHGDVILHAGQFWLIVDGWLASSNDGITWVTDNQGIGLGPRDNSWDDGSRIYRATLAPTLDGGMRVWYSRDGSGASDPENWQTGYTILPQSLWPDPS